VNPPNPNGANSTTSDPREQTCWDLYVQSILDGRESAQQAAIDAGYEEATAKNVTLRGWFKGRKEKLHRREMLSKAERVLDRTLDMQPVNDKGQIDVPLLRVQTDVAKIVVTTLGKNEGYSTKTETDITSNGETIKGFTYVMPKE